MKAFLGLGICVPSCLHVHLGVLLIGDCATVVLFAGFFIGVSG